MPVRRSVRSLLALTASVALVVGMSPTGYGGHSHKPHKPSPPPVSGDPLPLGQPGLHEERTSEELQPGVTLTTIVRGALDGSETWTVEMIVPSGSTDPDPDAPLTALRDQESAEQLAADLVADGFDARAEVVITPTLADYAGGELGWRVRVGAFGTSAEADAENALLSAAGYSGSTLFTGWDGDDPNDAGPWVVQAITIDPKKFRGSLDAVFGPDIETKERTSDLAAAAGATAGVNAGFFVFDVSHGAPGDPAGLGVYDGRLLSENVGERPSLLLREDAKHTDVVRVTWEGWLEGRDRLRLDGINRVPGLIRNCGGIGDDPTDLPLHDITCTDDSELVLFTPDFAASTPSGDGVEVVLNRKGKVTEVRSERGGSVPSKGMTVQATGDLVDDLLGLARQGKKLRVTAKTTDESGRKVNFSPRESVVNGGPELVRDGEQYVTVTADGMVQPDNPSFYYGWAHKRNPRTIAGVDEYGRTLLVTSDGRDTDSFGLSMAESGAVAQALGMHDALNLDGGGSTTMVVDDEVINDPSGDEREVGDAILILPGRQHGKR